MATAPKFTFDTEFRAEGDVISTAARSRQKKTMTVEEIEAMCAQAEAQGTRAASVQAAENIDRMIAGLIAALRAALD